MSVHWILADDASLPAGTDWLGPEETKVLSGLKLAKRRHEWLLGRYAAKMLVASWTNTVATDRIEIVAADDGAPEAFVGGHPLDVSLSISHRDGVAVSTLSETAAVGCDLEAVEPRTSRFVADFFTERESAAAESSAGEERDLRVALTWSAKESTLKVLRVGLRRDTRDVEVELEGLGAREGWQRFEARLRPEQRLLRGWWTRRGGLVLTIASGAAPGSPSAPSEPGPRNRVRPRGL